MNPSSPSPSPPLLLLPSAAPLEPVPAAAAGGLRTRSHTTHVLADGSLISVQPGHGTPPPLSLSELLLPLLLLLLLLLRTAAGAPRPPRPVSERSVSHNSHFVSAPLFTNVHPGHAQPVRSSFLDISLRSLPPRRIRL